MNNHRQKQDHKAMASSKKKIFLERKQVRNITNKVPKIVKVMNYVLLIFHVKFLLQLSVFYKI